MCGINGIYGLKDEVVAKQKVATMNNTMHHRGPDDHGIFYEDNIVLGHQRLSIIDLTAAGHQPMHSYDGRYHIVYNGELYNFRDLKFELQRVVSGSGQQSYFFQTNSDTEVIIAAYARWGADCLKHFNGMFAFAIWDSVTKELFIARDRLGIKPLYYFFTEGIFAFSSEIRSLVSNGIIPKKLDEDSLTDYLRYQTVHAPNTMLKGVKMLMPGHAILLKDGKPVIRKYWELSCGQKKNDKSYQEVCKDVNDLLTSAVQRRLIADVPFGAFLSGGIDSSAIVGLMSKVSSEKVKTFTVTFDESEFSEAQYATMIAKKFNTDHHEIKLRPEDFLKELPNALKSMDHPSGDGPNTYVVSKATRNAGITMALSGLGGDEVFGGYEVFKRNLEIRNKAWMNAVPKFARFSAGALMKNLKPGIGSEKMAAFLQGEKINFEHFYPLSRQVLMDDQIKKLLKNEQLTENVVSKVLKTDSVTSRDFIISRTSIAEISTYMQNVLLRDTDQMSMAHALEVRVPFIDYTLVEYVLELPDRYKSTSSPKKLLVDALGDLLPSDIVNRPKMGFTLPWKQWMKRELRPFCEERMTSLSKRNFFNEQEVIKLWTRFLSDDARISWSRIWYLVVLEEWMQCNGIEN